MSSLQRAREFFAPRAATWDARFPGDAPAFADAVRALRLPMGGAVLDAGCGTGRAAPLLRDAVGPAGTVVGVDATPEMLAAARGATRGASATLALGDASLPPFRPGAFDGVLAAGLVTHLADPLDGEDRYLAVAQRV